MSRAVHFEIHATNPQVLIDFYAGLFGAEPDIRPAILPSAGVASLSSRVP